MIVLIEHLVLFTKWNILFYLQTVNSTYSEINTNIDIVSNTDIDSNTNSDSDIDIIHILNSL